jgi:hypothetical protein
MYLYVFLRDAVYNGDDPVLWIVGWLNIQLLAYLRQVKLVAFEKKGHC